MRAFLTSPWWHRITAVRQVDPKSAACLPDLMWPARKRGKIFQHRQALTNQTPWMDSPSSEAPWARGSEQPRRRRRGNRTRASASRSRPSSASSISSSATLRPLLRQPSFLQTRLPTPPALRRTQRRGLVNVPPLLGWFLRNHPLPLPRTRKRRVHPRYRRRLPKASLSSASDSPLEWWIPPHSLRYACSCGCAWSAPTYRLRAFRSFFWRAVDQAEPGWRGGWGHLEDIPCWSEAAISHYQSFSGRSICPFHWLETEHV